MRTIESRVKLLDSHNQTSTAAQMKYANGQLFDNFKSNFIMDVIIIYSRIKLDLF